MAYFAIYQGLRGCYMPDSSYIVKADTRRDLKRILQWEADSIRDAGGIGMSKKAIAWLAAESWRNRKNRSGEYVAPYRFDYHGANNYCMALGVFTGASRAEYLAQED